jgi:Na+/melibiose symporter-like transporter
VHSDAQFEKKTKLPTQGVIKKMLNDSDALWNLLMMVIAWTGTTFTYFLVIFYVKYLPGNIYTNQVVSSFSVFAYLIAPVLARKFDNKKIMIIGYIITLVFLIIMIVFQYLEISEILYSLIFLMFKCGN